MAAPSLEHAIISLLMQESRPVRTQMGPALLFAGFLAVAGGGFLVTAGYDWLVTHYDLQTARLVVGAGTLLPLADHLAEDRASLAGYIAAEKLLH